MKTKQKNMDPTNEWPKWVCPVDLRCAPFRTRTRMTNWAKLEERAKPPEINCLPIAERKIE